MILLALGVGLFAIACGGGETDTFLEDVVIAAPAEDTATSDTAPDTNAPDSSTIDTTVIDTDYDCESGETFEVFDINGPDSGADETTTEDTGDVTEDPADSGADSAQDAFTCPDCGTAEQECLVYVQDPMTCECSLVTAPDGDDCGKKGLCHGGECVTYCHEGACPAGLSKFDGCLCRVVATESNVCTYETEHVPCNEITPGTPYFGQDAQLVGGMRMFANNGDGTIIDHDTGLVWTEEKAGPMTIENAEEYCDVLELKDVSWRLPTIHELFTLVSAGNPPCMWPAVFDGTFNETECANNRLYWSSTRAYMSANVCVLYPRANIEDCQRDETSQQYVRCVMENDGEDDGLWQVQGFSGENATDAIGSEYNRFEVLDWVVLDRATGVVWESEFSALNVSWETALATCEAKGPGWRLPTTTELVSILDFSIGPNGCARWNQALGTTCLSNLYFWSSTANPLDAVAPFACHTESGHIHEQPVFFMHNARCVKSVGW